MYFIIILYYNTCTNKMYKTIINIYFTIIKVNTIISEHLSDYL